MNWQKGLQEAPKISAHEFEFRKVLAFENGNTPAFVIWHAYDEETAKSLGVEGYWDYEESLVSDVDGMIDPSREADIWWTEMDLSKVVELSRTHKKNNDPGL